MFDLDMNWSGDLRMTPTGDLSLVSEPTVGTNRVLRRLLTNPNEYIWNPGYGAGLAHFVGRPSNPAAIEATVRSQMKLEAAVASVPEPIVSISSDYAGRLFLQIRYEDSDTATVSTVVASILE